MRENLVPHFYSLVSFIDKEELKNAPISYQNWINSTDPSFEVRSSEYLLYTDAHLVDDQIIFGPYKLINTVAKGSNWHRKYVSDALNQPTLAYDIQCLPALALQIDHYFYKVQHLDTDWSKKQDENYHRGFLEDEVSAWVSLCLGIWLQSSGATCEFSDTTKSNGRPIAYNLTKTPSFPTPSPHGVTIIPNLNTKCHIELMVRVEKPSRSHGHAGHLGVSKRARSPTHPDHRRFYHRIVLSRG